MKWLLLSLLMFIYTAGFSQATYFVDRVPKRIPTEIYDIPNRITLNIAKYTKVTTGSAYFNEEWMRAVVNITDTTIAKNVRVRLDLLDGSLEFQNDKGEELVAATPVYSVLLIDSATGQRYTFIPSSRITKANNKAWYQVLSSGEKITLLKEYFKELVENNHYATPQTGLEIRTTEKYFVMIDNNLTRVKKLSDITGLAGDKAELLKKFADKNDLSMRRETDLVTFIEYYHTLK